ncbi:cysteine protease inhibitor staphostatin B [Staphylococcus warneri]|uniref:cysteine protease inhibitor staphostatin B n=1 Tax=Staphylococcus warneri TaxID=1292 RepID=UPI0032604BB9
MYQLQFIHINDDTLTKSEQDTMQLFVGNWINQSIQKSFGIHIGVDTSHNQYQILQIDTEHQRITLTSEENPQLMYILDYEDSKHIIIQTSVKNSYGTSRPIRYEKC